MSRNFLSVLKHFEHYSVVGTNFDTLCDVQ